MQYKLTVEAVRLQRVMPDLQVIYVKTILEKATAGAYREMQWLIQSRVLQAAEVYLNWTKHEDEASLYESSSVHCGALSCGLEAPTL